MKKILFALFTLMLTMSAVFAQAPQKFSYQAVVRNANNQLVANSNVGVRVSVLQGSIFGASEYVETHAVTTNANGLLTLNVGDGTALQGSMSDIDWGNGPYFLKTEMDPDGGTNYSVTSTQQLMSVPYALYAAEAGNVPDFSVTTNIVAGVGTYVTITDGSGPHTFLVPESSSGGGGTLVQQQADWAESDTSVVSYIRNKPNLAPIATSGDYHDLINAPATPNLDSLLNNFNQAIASLTQRLDSLQGDSQIPADTTPQTNFHCESTTLTDVDGNVYNTVLIGNQCWMRENLRCSHYADGSPIPLGGITSNTVAYRYYPNHSSSNVATYGYLYNWAALTHEIPVSSENNVGIRGVCPAGWRIPTQAEWSQLVNYMGSQSEYTLNGNSSYIAKALSYTSYWNTNSSNYSPGNDMSSNNASGFSAVPAGKYSGDYSDFGYCAYFWTATENSSLSAKCFSISASSAFINYSSYEKSSAMSVRCVLGDTMVLTVPSVTTDAASNIRISAATSGGNVNATGGAGVTAKGVCWSTSPNPTIDDFLTAEGNGTGTFTSELADLTPGTTYYLRAYATNCMGTGYGEEVSFTTLAVPTGDAQPCPNNATVTDIDGNVYNTVQIGDQCWMRENLRTTHYADSSAIPLGATSTYSETSPCRYNPNNSAGNVATYGYLYNWPAVMHDESPSNENPSGVQGVCPSGWHVPSETEWGQLMNYLNAHEQYMCGNNANYIAKALASTEGWENSTNSYVPGNNPSVNNATGFSAVPAGYYSGSFSYFGTCAYFWSTAEYYNSNNYYYAKYVQINYSNVNPYWSGNNYAGKSQAYSVRCVLGAGTPVSVPTVTTIAVSNIRLWAATSGGNVSSTGGGNVTAKGVCWSTSQNPTVDDLHTVEGEGPESFTSELANLIQGTTYYLRAYATNYAGTGYGEEVSFTTLAVPDGDAQPCPNNATVTDIDGNVYNTVQIGDQCWMRENLRTTHYADSSIIPLGATSTTSETTPCRYNPNNSAGNVDTYGYLYNWSAVMHDESPSNENPSGVQGVCPSGWHVPSETEWGQLMNYLGSHEQYICGNSTSYIAKALASTEGWDNNTSSYVPGNNPSVNNATGFSAMPAGYFSGSFSYFGSYAYFWSTNEYINNNSNNYAKYVQINYSSANPYWSGNNYTGKGQAYSVRCVLGAGTPVTAPIVTTDAPRNIMLWTATAGGNVASTGGGNVTAKGVCWSTSSNPMLDDSHTVEGEGTGTFTSALNGLTAGTTYYMRAYATNFVGTAYGEEVSFTTLAVPAGDAQPCPNNATVTDYNNNVYNTVKIGDQCWMRENLRSTHYADGTPIPLGSTTTTSETTPCRYNPNNSAGNVTAYGYLYNWAAVMHDETPSNANPSGVQGVCPTGWHVPSEAEWGQLMNYLSSHEQYICGNNSSYIAKALASTDGWDNTTSSNVPGNNPNVNNATGFSAMSAGYYSGSFSSLGYYAYFWSTTEYNSSQAKYVQIYTYNAAPYWTNNNYSGKYYAYSVRCVLGAGTPVTAPIVTTDAPSNIRLWTATAGGNVASTGGGNVTVKGICWSTSPNPTLDDSYTVDGVGTGTFTSSLTGLTAGTTYYVRAYATNFAGTGYGEDVPFTTLTVPAGDAQPCSGNATVTDGDGNVYNTVQIGNQCWMRENLRSTHYADGTAIPLGATTSTTTAYRYNPNNNSSLVATHGYLYNWVALMNDQSSSSANPSGVQGICPTGWHVPSDAEWGQLMSYLSNNAQYYYGVQYSSNGYITAYYIAQALASTEGWNGSTGSYTVGSNLNINNASGFTALPVGYYDGGYGSFGSYTCFWSSTQNGNSYAYGRSLSYYDAVVNSSTISKGHGYSVRCLRD